MRLTPYQLKRARMPKRGGAGQGGGKLIHRWLRGTQRARHDFRGLRTWFDADLETV